MIHLKTKKYDIALSSNSTSSKLYHYWYMYNEQQLNDKKIMSTRNRRIKKDVIIKQMSRYLSLAINGNVIL